MKNAIVFLILIIGFTAPAIGESVVLVDISDPGSLKVDDRYVYIVEGSRIYIYSRSDFKLIKKLGKPGDESGGFRARSNGRFQLYLDINTNRILVSSEERLSVFSKDFQLLKESKLPPQFGFVEGVGQHFTGTNYYWDKGPTVTERIMLFRLGKKGLDYIRTLHQTKSGGGRITGLKPYKMNDFPVIPNIISHQSEERKVYVGRAEPGRYRIDVFGEDGKQLDSITGLTKKLRVTFPDEIYELKVFKSGILWEKYSRIIHPVVPEFYPAFKQFRVNKNRIFLFTFQRKGEFRKAVILDPAGKRLGRAWLPLAKYYAVFGGNYYYLNHNDHGEWTLNAFPFTMEDK